MNAKVTFVGKVEIRFMIPTMCVVSLKVYKSLTLKSIFFQVVLNIVVYQMLIATNVPVNSAAL